MGYRWGQTGVNLHRRTLSRHLSIILLASAALAVSACCFLQEGH